MLYAAAALLGALAGLIIKKTTALMINRRAEDKMAQIPPANAYITFTWIALCSALWLIAAFAGGMSVASVRLALVGTLCLSLSAVDLKIRKIPNELLLSLLVIQTGYLILSGNALEALTSLGGLAAGLIIFLLPAFMGKSAGLGDVKLAGVTGFVLGFHGLIAAMLLMSVLILGYTAVLLATKKGGLKTKLALGPYITAGTITVMTLNILSNNSYLDLTKLMLP